MYGAEIHIITDRWNGYETIYKGSTNSTHSMVDHSKNFVVKMHNDAVINPY